MPRYGVEKLGVTRYEAKIKCGNAASLRLFQERLGFREVSRSHVFQAGAPPESPLGIFTKKITFKLLFMEPEPGFFPFSRGVADP
jgi:hypothetical protein